MNVAITASLVLVTAGVACHSPADAAPGDSAPAPSGDEGPSCPTSLDDEALPWLEIETLFSCGTLGMRPGDQRDLALVEPHCCWLLIEVETCVEWSVDPGASATIDPETGLLAVDPSATHGETFWVYADVEQGRRVVSAQVFVYTQEGNPVVGLWWEEAGIDCTTGEEIPPAGAPAQLWLGADQAFWLRWTLLEVRTDYHGEYEVDADAQSLDLTIDVNYSRILRADIDPSGSFEASGETLILREMWLGTSPYLEELQTGCGHRFSLSGRY